ncbi:hypothetical protein BJX70DRAFT_383990 [Aspergillus crustosus]
MESSAQSAVLSSAVSPKMRSRRRTTSTRTTPTKPITEVVTIPSTVALTSPVTHPSWTPLAASSTRSKRQAPLHGCMILLPSSSRIYDCGFLALPCIFALLAGIVRLIGSLSVSLRTVPFSRIYILLLCIIMIPMLLRGMLKNMIV